MNQPSRRVGLIIDREPLWLNVLEDQLAELQVDVVARSSTAAQILDLVREHEPDLVVLGHESGGADPGLLSAIQQIKTFDQRTEVIIVCPDVHAPAIEATFAAGASAYCIKSATPEDLTVAIRQTFNRSLYLPPFQGTTPNPPQAGVDHPAANLTRRETEILRLVAEGQSNSQVARMLRVTEQTVKFHLSNVYRKLNVANRTEASRWAPLFDLLPASELVETAPHD